MKEGRYPSNRRDGTPCAKSDRKRSELKRALPGKGILCEARGDWDWLNSWFNLPTWNTGSGMCWLCKAKYCDFKEQSPECRNAGLGKAEFLARVRAMGKQVCPLWGWPEMAPDVLILQDWLHAVDQGIGADIAGQLLVDLSKQQLGANFSEQVANLWQETQALYKEYQIEYCLVNLTPEILNKSKKNMNKKATLKGPAAHIRYLVLLLPILTAKYFSMGSRYEQACHKLAVCLARSYGATQSNDLAEMPEHGRKVAGQYMALERDVVRREPDTNTWRIMPKLHQYLHLTECGYPIQEFWCYADEGAGGLLARLYKRRGGREVPGTHCARMLESGNSSQNSQHFHL